MIKAGQRFHSKLMFYCLFHLLVSWCRYLSVCIQANLFSFILICHVALMQQRTCTGRTSLCVKKFQQTFNYVCRSPCNQTSRCAYIHVVGITVLVYGAIIKHAHYNGYISFEDNFNKCYHLFCFRTKCCCSV